jgi:hypothetical protein
MKHFEMTLAAGIRDIPVVGTQSSRQTSRLRLTHLLGLCIEEALKDNLMSRRIGKTRSMRRASEGSYDRAPARSRSAITVIRPMAD